MQMYSHKHIMEGKHTKTQKRNLMTPVRTTQIRFD